MKKLMTGILFANIFYNVYSQNVGIGTTSPESELEIKGNLSVSAKTVISESVPTIAQTKTIVCNATSFFSSSDSVGNFSGTCGTGLSFNCANVPNGSGTNQFFKLNINITSGASGAGWKLIFFPINSFVPLITFDHNNIPANGAPYFINASGFNCYWVTNSSGQAINGIDVSFTRIYSAGSNNTFMNFAANSLYYNTSKGSFSAGNRTKQSQTPLGIYSTSLGYETFAYGDYSTALGYGTKTVSPYSLVVGKYNDDFGVASLFQVGMGNSNTDRSNAFSVDADGGVKTRYSGSIVTSVAVGTTNINLTIPSLPTTPIWDFTNTLVLVSNADGITGTINQAKLTSPTNIQVNFSATATGPARFNYIIFKL